jgi:uncharacterized phage protein gp47/JayE
LPFSRPSLQDLVDRITTDFQTRIDGADSILRRSALRVIAKVNAAAIHLLYGFLDFQANQLFATTADTTGLDTIAAEYGVDRRAAAQATGSGTATGTNGINIPAGTELQNSDSVKYTTDAAATIAGGVATIAFTAVEGGTDGNDDASVVITFSSPIAGIDSNFTVDSNGITGGTDLETDSSLRGRVLLRKRKPPHGGAEYDYEAWALEVSGVTRVWGFSNIDGPGSIGLAFVRDDDSTIIPNATQRQAVRDYIVEHTDPGSGETVGIPVTAEPGFRIVELFELEVDLEIDISPNTAAVQTAIENELESLILNSGGPEQTLYLSKIGEAISLAAGESHHRLDSPTADITAANNQLHVLGTITWGSY